jgi:hypothetical protein
LEVRIVQKKLYKFVSIATMMLITMAMSVNTAMAKPGAQNFEVYDNTQDGLQVATDPDTGNIEANANPGGQARLILEVHAQKVAPNCVLTVELVRDSAVVNGGLSAAGHSGFTQVLGTITTNGVGNGNGHFDVEVGDGTLDTDIYGHVDLEDYNFTCKEKDGTGVAINEYGGAPDPTLTTPLTWKE